MSSDITQIKKSSHKPGTVSTTAEDVATYLKANPDFFIDRDNLLAELELPHQSGKAISLLERQVKILRERSIESRQTLHNLLENARHNDQLFQVTRNLILTLLDEDDVAQLISVTEANLATQPGIDACTLLMTDISITGKTRPTRAAAVAELQQRFPSLFQEQRVICQSVDRETAAVLFPGHNSTVRSVALCPVKAHGKLLGILTLGNHSRDYFNGDLDTLFLEFIADVLGSIIEKAGP